QAAQVYGAGVAQSAWRQVAIATGILAVGHRGGVHGEALLQECLDIGSAGPLDGLGVEDVVGLYIILGAWNVGIAGLKRLDALFLHHHLVCIAQVFPALLAPALL